jgi:muconolactone delta-isomerase
VRVAIIFRQRSAAPFEALPMMMEALGQWVDTYSKRASTIEFFAMGGGLVLADFDDASELHRLVAENPFTAFMDVEVIPVIEPTAAMATWGQAMAALTSAAQPPA